MNLIRTYESREVAEALGITKKTLYAWLKKGWIKEPKRDYRNYRVWTDNDIKAAKQFKEKLR